jgi:protein-S-isoprenylcysteine O-methyltransferase Ste14
MTDKTKGRNFVSGQFVLLALIVFWPEQKGGWGLLDFPATIAGVLLTAVGLAMLLLAIVGLGRSLTASPIPKDDAVLVRRGFYKFMRHPIYTGLMAFALGVGLDAGPAPHMLFVLGLFTLLYFKARWEETLLLVKYPEYKSYMTKTGMFLPRIDSGSK